MPSDNVTYDWCWECCAYHRTDPGQPLNTKCPRKRPFEGNHNSAEDLKFQKERSDAIG
jgi:hypothetical protein